MKKKAQYVRTYFRHVARLVIFQDILEKDLTDGKGKNCLEFHERRVKSTKYVYSPPKRVLLG